MGVDYLICDHCGETFPDCDHFGECTTCGRVFCADCWDEVRVNPDSDSEDDEQDYDCCYCTAGPKQLFNTDDILKFLLEKHGTTREAVVDEMRKPAEEDTPPTQVRKLA